MEKILELFAFFLLTLLGFVAPVLAIVLSIYAQGLKKLAQQYEDERNQTEEKLKGQLQKIGDVKTIDLTEIKKTIKELQKVKRTATRKLQLLSPKKALIYVYAPLIAAFLVLLPTFVSWLRASLGWLPLLSLILVCYSLYELWKVLDILMETMKRIEFESSNEQRRGLELLAEIVRNTKEGAALFIERVFVRLDKTLLNKEENELTLHANKKSEISVALVNIEAQMAKDVEAGFSFPTEFLIEKSSGYSIYATGSEQIVRYSSERIHGNTSTIMSPLKITPLKPGEFQFQTFMKGENIKSKYRKLKIRVN